MAIIKVGEVYKTKNYGDMEVIEYIDAYNIKVKFIDTGTECIASSGNIRKGNVSDFFKRKFFGVGFLGKRRQRGVNERKAYTRWYKMLHRCYSGEFKSYVGCEVALEWHNFQNFLSWFNENYPRDNGDYDLDKDILFDGNKIYSPQTCMFVTHSENMRYVNRNKKPFLVFNKSLNTYKIVNCLAEFSREYGIHSSTLSLLRSKKVKDTKGWSFKGEIINLKHIEV